MQNTPPDPATWGARFGWLVGGAFGLVAGFALSYLLERSVFRAASDPIRAASRASAVVVPVLFVAGALAGHAFGARGGVRRYRSLGIAAGITIAVLGWALLVLTR